MPRMRIDSLTAIDVHVHIESDGRGCYSLDDELMDASAKYFRADHDRSPTLEQIADLYRSLRMAAVVFTVDAGTSTGHQALSSEEIADKAAAHADVLIPFGSVDPLRGAAAVEQARRLVTEHGARGFKFHPSLQGFAPNDPAFYPLWAQIESLGVPALFHTGQTGIGAGLPGGRGIKLRLSDPMLLDDVAADFPALDGDPRAPVGAVGGLVDLDGDAQVQRVHRPVRLVAEVLPARPGARGELLPAGQGAVRHRLPAADPGAVAARLRGARPQAGRQPQDPQGQRRAGVAALGEKLA